MKCATEYPTKNIEPSLSKVKKAISWDHSYTTDPMEPTDASKEITLQNEMRILKQKLKQRDQKITNMVIAKWNDAKVTWEGLNKDGCSQEHPI